MSIPAPLPKETSACIRLNLLVENTPSTATLPPDTSPKRTPNSWALQNEYETIMTIATSKYFFIIYNICALEAVGLVAWALSRIVKNITITSLTERICFIKENVTFLDFTIIDKVNRI